MPANTLQYNTAVTIFFVPYTLLEVPSNIILKKMRPSYWMAILMFCWGTVMTLMGVVSSYHGLLAGRFFLGVTEVCEPRAGGIHRIIGDGLYHDRVASRVIAS
jgi:hypothetical protein